MTEIDELKTGIRLAISALRRIDKHQPVDSNLVLKQLLVLESAQRKRDAFKGRTNVPSAIKKATKTAGPK